MNRTYMSLEEVVERYQAGERNFVGISLYDKVSKILEDVDLSEINLSGANLSRIRWKRVNLSGACLRRTNFTFSILTSVNLSHANLSYAHLLSSVWSDVDLSHACMARAFLSHSALKDANLFDTNLEETILLHVRLKGSTNANPLRMGGAFNWKLMMPDGNMNPGWHFVDYPN